MKILVGIPVVSGYKHTMEAINSVLNQENVELLIIDNNATEDIKELFKQYEPLENVTIKVNENNIYVNPAWNQIMFHFLSSDCDLLVIMNSDLTLQINWSDILRYWYQFKDNASFLPVVLNDCVKLERLKNVQIYDGTPTVVTEGTAGIFISLNKKQCELVYDIPELIKVWYGDNWIYGILRGCGHKTVIASNLFCFHGLSQTVSKIQGIDDLIAQDRFNWNNNVEPYMNELITKHNERNNLSQHDQRED